MRYALDLPQRTDLIVKHGSRIALLTITLLVASVAEPAAARAQGPDLIPVIEGPTSLQAGLSGTFKVTVWNFGDQTAPVELHIIFAGKLDQTDRIVPEGGLACEVGHDAGINAVVRCTGGQAQGGGAVSVIVQGRGQSAGIGKLVATANASRSVAEKSYENNLRQYNVTIK